MIVDQAAGAHAIVALGQRRFERVESLHRAADAAGRQPRCPVM
jgi:hypothetical protein